jgi:hypothetical protein
MPGPGGSRKGIKNLRTQYAEYQRVAKNFRGDQFVGESLAVMGRAMHFFVEMAMRAETAEEARIYWNDALNAGEKLAPFRYAKLASVRVGVERDDILARDDVTSAELLAELVAELATCTEIPSFIRDYIESGGTVDLSRAKTVPATVSPSNGGGVATSKGVPFPAMGNRARHDT